MSAVNGALPSVGRIVHFALPKGMRHAGECRAAIVRRVFPAAASEGPCNLTIFLDGQNDQDEGAPPIGPPLLMEGDSVRFDEGRAPGTWHWPERVP